MSKTSPIELFITEEAVEKHVTGIFHKLGLGLTPIERRRVRAVLTYLQAPRRSQSSSSWWLVLVRRVGMLESASTGDRVA